MKRATAKFAALNLNLVGGEILWIKGEMSEFTIKRGLFKYKGENYIKRFIAKVDVVQLH